MGFGIDDIAPVGINNLLEIVDCRRVVAQDKAESPALRVTEVGCIVHGGRHDTGRVNPHASPARASRNEIVGAQGGVCAVSRGACPSIVDLEPFHLNRDIRQSLPFVLVVGEFHVDVCRVAKRVVPDIFRGHSRRGRYEGRVRVLRRGARVDLIRYEGAVFGIKLIIEPNLIDPADLMDAVDFTLSDDADKMQFVVIRARRYHVADVHGDALQAVNQGDVVLIVLTVHHLPARSLFQRLEGVVLVRP